MEGSRTYGSASEMSGGIGSVVASLPRLWSAYRSRRIEPGLREKIMFTVSEVNACQACSWAHTRLAVREGISAEELDRLQLPAAGNRRQRVALTYAIACADVSFQTVSDPEIERALTETFTGAERRDIDAILHLIINANRTSNTIEAHAPTIVHRSIARLSSRTRPLADVRWQAEQRFSTCRDKRTGERL